MLLPKNTAHQTSLFGTDLLQQLDVRDPLLQLAEIIPWSELEQAFAKHYTPGVGCPAKPIRLMVGLQLLKYLENLSDEKVVVQFKRNPYYQSFCGQNYDVDDMVNQLKAASDLIVKRKFSNKSNPKGVRGMFWGVEQLVTTEQLTSNEIQQFFEEISLNNKPFQTQASFIKSEIPKKDEIASKRLASDYWQNNQRLIIENKKTKKKSQIDISDFFYMRAFASGQ